jgi:predicted NBD/HSP70 family sugar kinase
MTTRAGELLRVVHENPGVTRADAARRVGIGTGAATELVARLTAAELLSEHPADPSGSRGRPTTVLVPHPNGPLILAAAITHESWRMDVVELGGAIVDSVAGPHGSAELDAAGLDLVGLDLAGLGSGGFGVRGDVLVRALKDVVAELRHRWPGRIRGMGVSAPGTVTKDALVDATNLGWTGLDLSALAWAEAEVFVAGNDATLAAAAESSRGAAVGASVALHLRIDGGLGGAVVDAGRVLTGAAGLAGEFGHMPFGDPAVRCPCGANGCWGTAVDGSALARSLGHETPRDPVTYARRVIAQANRPAAGNRAERAAVDAAASALGRGIAGLVNGLDPDLVTLGGLAVDLLATAPDPLKDAYQRGLMGFRRSSPPPIVPGALLEDAPLAGAAEQVWLMLFSILVSPR